MRLADSRFVRTLCGTTVFAILSAAAVRTSNESVVTPAPSRPSRASTASAPRRNAEAHVRNKYVKLPMRFEPNAGRTDAAIDFIARGAGYAVYVAGTSTSLLVDPSARSMPSQRGATAVERPERISMRLAGSRANRTPENGRINATRHSPLWGRPKDKGVRGKSQCPSPNDQQSPNDQ